MTVEASELKPLWRTCGCVPFQVMKDLAFPDATWQRYVTIPSGIYVGGGLTLYWLIGYLAITGGEASPVVLLVSV